MSDDNFVEELVEHFASETAENTRERFMRIFEKSRSRCGSPIEERLLAALIGVLSFSHDLLVEYAVENFNWDDDRQDIPRNTDAVCYGDHRDAMIFQQANLGDYRVDFLIRIGKAHGGAWMVVECDGHDYHERTKEQARHDKARDRWMIGRRLLVLRFTGSEIWADSIRCATEVAHVIYRESYNAPVFEEDVVAKIRSLHYFTPAIMDSVAARKKSDKNGQD